MSWCQVEGCTAHGGSGSSVKALLKPTPADRCWPMLTDCWGWPSTEWIYLFISKTLSLLWSWLPTGRRLRGRTRSRDPLYYGPPLHICPGQWSCYATSSYHGTMSWWNVMTIRYVVMLSCHVVMSSHLVVMSYHQVKSRCSVMSYRYVMSFCNGMLL
jgi:hypothetical protein